MTASIIMINMTRNQSSAFKRVYWTCQKIPPLVRIHILHFTSFNTKNYSLTVNYHSWLENIRFGINSWRDHKEFEGLTNFEFSQKVLRQLKLKTSEDFVKYILNHSSLTILKASDNKTINYNIALLLEQIDLNRSFLFPMLLYFILIYNDNFEQ